MARTKAILIRLTEKEHAALARVAGLDGIRVATWARRTFMRRVRARIGKLAAARPQVTQ